MEAKIDNFKHINLKDKDCVVGFIRNIEKLLSKQKSINNTPNTIPMLIFQLCTLYYGLADCWDEYNCFESYEIIDQTILKQTKDYTTRPAFLPDFSKPHSGRRYPGANTQ